MAPIDLWTRWGWRHEYAAARPRGAAAAAADVADRAGSSASHRCLAAPPSAGPDHGRGRGRRNSVMGNVSNDVLITRMHSSPPDPTPPHKIKIPLPPLLLLLLLGPARVPPLHFPTSLSAH